MKINTKPGCHKPVATLLILSFLILCSDFFMTPNRLNAEVKMAFRMISTVFDNKDTIPMKYTCEGQDLSPPLRWEGVPEKAKSLVLIVDDPDAPDPKAPKMRWVHWVLFNIPANATGLPEGVKKENLPAGTEEGINDWIKTGYGGPCPPIGRHRYFFTLYALDTTFQELKRPTRAHITAAMNGHIIARAELVGTYEKSR